MSDTPLTHLMFDIETLGVRERAVVTTLACVPFTLEDDKTYKQHVKDGFFVKFDVKEQISKYARVTDPDTISWWKGQSNEAKKNSILPSENDQTLADGCSALRRFIKGTDYDFKNSFIWSRGCYFDFPKIEDLYRDLGEKPPFNGFKIRDTRTMIDVLTGSLRGDYNLEGGTPDGFVHHHALHDCALEIAKMKEIYKSLL